VPAWIERARRVEEEIERMAFDPKTDFEEPLLRIRVIDRVSSVFAKMGMTMDEAARAFGAKWTCSYCGARNAGTRCSNCGAEEQ
jgi:hypothetical protein